MIREILFKAQRESDRKWVEGTYHKSQVGTYLFVRIEGDQALMMAVDPSTVCQLWKRQKDGTPLFAGDIGIGATGIMKYIVKWDDRGPRWAYHPMITVSTELAHHAFTNRSLIVTGNIHDVLDIEIKGELNV